MILPSPVLRSESLYELSVIGSRIRLQKLQRLSMLAVRMIHFPLVCSALIYVLLVKFSSRAVAPD